MSISKHLDGIKQKFMALFIKEVKTEQPETEINPEYFYKPLVANDDRLGEEKLYYFIKIGQGDHKGRPLPLGHYYFWNSGIDAFGSSEATSYESNGVSSRTNLTSFPHFIEMTKDYAWTVCDGVTAENRHELCLIVMYYNKCTTAKDRIPTLLLLLIFNFVFPKEGTTIGTYVKGQLSILQKTATKRGFYIGDYLMERKN
jgi:hypothetical protein